MARKQQATHGATTATTGHSPSGYTTPVALPPLFKQSPCALLRAVAMSRSSPSDGSGGGGGGGAQDGRVRKYEVSLSAAAAASPVLTAIDASDMNGGSESSSRRGSYNSRGGSAGPGPVSPKRTQSVARFRPNLFGFRFRTLTKVGEVPTWYFPRRARSRVARLPSRTAAAGRSVCSTNSCGQRTTFKSFLA